jgi:hypothetical protein
LLLSLSLFFFFSFSFSFTICPCRTRHRDAEWARGELNANLPRNHQAPVRQRQEPSPRAGLRGSVAKAARGTPDSRAESRGPDSLDSRPAGRVPGSRLPRLPPAGRVPGSRDPRLPPRRPSPGVPTPSTPARRPSPGVPRPSTPAPPAESRGPDSLDSLDSRPPAESRGPETLDSRPAGRVPGNRRRVLRRKRKRPGEQRKQTKN